MNSLLAKQMNFNKKVKINFNGWELTSDSGLFYTKNLIIKLGLVT
ncbi:hypothetical protein [Clostridium sp. DL1XJH146]